MAFLSDASPVEQLVLPGTRDLGGFAVRRALPAARRRTVGPFVLLDGLGPAVFGPGDGLDVRPHPHIGLATLSYLLEGETVHRDSAGHAAAIRAGDVALMTAGRGIVHSERSGTDARARPETLRGFQAWLGLPQAHEEVDPSFQHVSAGDVPLLADHGIAVRLLAGGFGGRTASVRGPWDLLYADVALADGARFPVDSPHVERALHVVDGAIAVEGQTGRFGAGELVVLRPGAEVIVRATGPTRLILLGGEPLDGPRHLFWNFVSSRRERIDRAAADWREHRFPTIPGDADEFVPLPTPSH